MPGIQIEVEDGIVFTEAIAAYKTNSVLECAWQGTGAALITHERARQKEVEGYEERDAEYGEGQLVNAASAYICLHPMMMRPEGYDLWKEYWPWPQEFFRPNDDPIRALTKAGALIAAEIDRLLALQQPAGDEEIVPDFPLL